MTDPNRLDDAPPRIEDFLDRPTRRLADWHWLWRRDERFPIRTHRGPLGALLVAFKRAFHHLVRVPQNDLWERQRVFNLILIERMQELDARLDQALERTDHLAGRVAHVEATVTIGLEEVMRHDDALFSRVDAELDRQSRRTRELVGELRAALALVGSRDPGSGIRDPREESGGGESNATRALATLVEEAGYLDLEGRYRGTEAEIAGRVAGWVPYLEGRGEILDLGCGRGETLAVLGAAGIRARGVDSSERMVAVCTAKGLRAEVGDLFAVLAACRPGSLGGVISLHVVEHLPADSLVDLTSLAFRALAPGGRLILETPNPLSVLVTARSFWLDPTHLRPVHPEYLEHCCRLAGFDSTERLELRPYPPAERLPELDLTELPDDQRLLADRINRLRDRIDELLFGFQDYALVATRPLGGQRDGEEAE